MFRSCRIVLQASIQSNFSRKSLPRNFNYTNMSQNKNKPTFFKSESHCHQDSPSTENVGDTFDYDTPVVTTPFHHENVVVPQKSKAVKRPITAVSAGESTSGNSFVDETPIRVNRNCQNAKEQEQKDIKVDPNKKSPELGCLKRLRRSSRSVSPTVSESSSSYAESEVSFCMSTFEARRRKNAPIRIAIEGNIAAGKSTFIRILERISENDPNCHWFVQPEPLEKWTKSKENGGNKGGNILDKFYKDPKRWAYTFEAYTFMSRMKQAIDAEKQVTEEMENREIVVENDNNTNFSAITFFERSVYSARMIFAENCYESGVLSPTEWSLYLDWTNYLIKKVKQLKLDGVIYLRCDPTICATRMKKRNRSEETTVPDEYLQALHAKYEVFFMQWLKEHHDVKNSDEISEKIPEMSPALKILMNKSHGTIFRAMKDVPILVVNCSEEFETDEKQREIMIQRVRDFLRRIEFDDSQDQELQDQGDLFVGVGSEN